jgi:hypothetical protein
MFNIILISGAGQLGSRYLQGLAQCNLPLKILVHDLSIKSLKIAKQRWEEVLIKNTLHEVSYITSLEELPTVIDIAIVSTASRNRVAAVDSISKNTHIKYWVLEKVLAQNLSDLDQLISTINTSPAWVNTPRRLMPWHQSIKEHLKHTGPFKFKVKGGSWDLACNTIHLLDLFSWWSDESLKDISTKGLDQNWFESKRLGYWEVTGELKAIYSGGSSAHISCDTSNEPVLISLRNNNSWLINESEGYAKNSQGIEINGIVKFQSDITALMVESILLDGSCNLPSLKESAELHKVFIHEMFNHWKMSSNPLASFVPIT